MEKLVRELVHADLGKNVVYSKENGDRHSGELVTFVFHRGAGSASMQIGEVSLSVPLDAKLAFP